MLEFLDTPINIHGKPILAIIYGLGITTIGFLVFVLFPILIKEWFVNKFKK